MPPIQPTWPPGADFDPDPAKAYYVIVGAGFSALLNHRTLTSARLGGRTILHIGSFDPWAQYCSADSMGQWPTVLSVPTFSSNFPGTADFLKCGDFAAATLQAWSGLPPFYGVNANVYRISQNSSGNYELHCFQGKQRITVQAEMVDICAGPGPSRRWSRKFVGDRSLWSEYKRASPGAAGWPRLVTGEAFLQQATTSGQRVAVIGGGPTAAWCVEKAQQAGAEVWWISKSELNPAFLPSRRNDTLAKGPVRRERKNGDLVIKGALYPDQSRTYFAEGFEASGIRALPANDVELTIRPVTGYHQPRYVDSGMNHLGTLAGPKVFDQVVVSIGQLKEQHERGSWARTVEALLRPARNRNRHLLKASTDNRVVGLQSLDGRLRILGSSALYHPDVERWWRQPAGADYFQSLPNQAQVLVGIAHAAVTIGLANSYFSPATMRHLNLASEQELEALLGPDYARTWVEMRATRVTPFTDNEVTQVTQKTEYKFA